MNKCDFTKVTVAIFHMLGGSSHLFHRLLMPFGNSLKIDAVDQSIIKYKLTMAIFLVCCLVVTACVRVAVRTHGVCVCGSSQRSWPLRFLFYRTRVQCCQRPSREAEVTI